MAVAPIEVEASLLYVNAKIWHGLETPAGLLTGKGLIVAILAMFLFTALNLFGIKWMAGEARNPKRDVPIAVVGSMLLGAALYIALPRLRSCTALRRSPRYRCGAATRTVSGRTARRSSA